MYELGTKKSIIGISETNTNDLCLGWFKSLLFLLCWEWKQLCFFLYVHLFFFQGSLANIVRRGIIWFAHTWKKINQHEGRPWGRAAWAGNHCLNGNGVIISGGAYTRSLHAGAGRGKGRKRVWGCVIRKYVHRGSCLLGFSRFVSSPTCWSSSLSFASLLPPLWYNQ